MGYAPETFLGCEVMTLTRRDARAVLDIGLYDSIPLLEVFVFLISTLESEDLLAVLGLQLDPSDLPLAKGDRTVHPDGVEVQVAHKLAASLLPVLVVTQFPVLHHHVSLLPAP